MRVNSLFLVAILGAVSALASATPTATRADQDGWIVVRLSGTPKEIGFEHGQLLANEIQNVVQVLRAEVVPETGKDWNWYRDNARQIFWPKLDPEYQEEITAIADGAKSKGANVDVDDILALNGHIELWQYYMPLAGQNALNFSVPNPPPITPSANPSPSPSPITHHPSLPISGAHEACSAFIATGSETKDGKIVMSQNFWWDYIAGEHWNVIFDITPEHGNHFIMDSLPGLIMSGTDWAENSAGLALTETTIEDFVGFDRNGIPEFERMRKAIQYSNSLEDMCSYLEKGNNGAYANTWLMADAKKNEIGKLELGLKNVTFQHTTDGYYYGCNFPENPKLIEEEAPNYHNDEAPREHRWQDYLTRYKGKIDLNLAEQFVCDSYDENTGQKDGMGGALCGKSPNWGAISARATDSDMIQKMQFMARFGIPDGTMMSVSNLVSHDPQYQNVPMKDLPAYPWTRIVPPAVAATGL